MKVLWIQNDGDLYGHVPLIEMKVCGRAICSLFTHVSQCFLFCLPCFGFLELVVQLHLVMPSRQIIVYGC